jgi:uncharacterized caspase-like protein
MDKPMSQNQRTRHGRPASAGHETKQTQPYYDKSWAVVVGIDDYGGRHDSLRNARNDAKEIARVLRQVYRFEEVHTLYNKKATKGAIETWLEDKLPKHTGENDRVIFFFAGHGVSRQLPQDGERGYLIPHNAQKDKYSDYVSMFVLRDACGLIPAKHIFIILDCCFSGIAAFRSRVEPPSSRRGVDDIDLRNLTEKRAWQIPCRCINGL